VSFSTLQQDAIVLARMRHRYHSGDHEDRMIEWMDEHNIQNSWQLASTLVNAGLDSDGLSKYLLNCRGNACMKFSYGSTPH